MSARRVSSSSEQWASISELSTDDILRKSVRRKTSFRQIEGSESDQSQADLLQRVDRAVVPLNPSHLLATATSSEGAASTGFDVSDPSAVHVSIARGSERVEASVNATQSGEEETELERKDAPLSKCAADREGTFVDETVTDEYLEDDASDAVDLLEYPSIRKFRSQERKTKIICAIGPSSRSVDVLCSLLDAGMNVARLNFSHGDHKYHGETVRNLRNAVELKRQQGWDYHCAVLLDTQGPEIRSGFLKEGRPVKLTSSQRLEISTDYSVKGDQFCITCNYKELPTSVKKGDTILVADGEITLRVISTDKHKGTVQTRVENTAWLGERKNMSLPGVTIRLPGITEKDRDDILNFALVNNVDIVSGSFIRTKKNVMAIRDCLGDKGKSIRVHAKIESIEGLLNIDEILTVADGIHISRGDLGMELPLSKLCLVQKAVTRKCNLAGKPVVTSTQMLQSMTRNPRPSHAECTDVANAVLDGTDCVMLSGETASGDYPVESVETMSRIIIEAERCLNYDAMYHAMRAQVLDVHAMSPLEAIASSAVETAVSLNSRLIVVLSVTGRMALLISKYRPWARILVATANPQTARQMSRSRGVTSLVTRDVTDPMVAWKHVSVYAKGCNWVHPGDRVVLVDTILDSDDNDEGGHPILVNHVGDEMRFDTVKILEVP